VVVVIAKFCQLVEQAIPHQHLQVKEITAGLAVPLLTPRLVAVVVLAQLAVVEPLQ
jgi:hypothetical protein